MELYVDNFDLKSTLLSGQVFRIIEEEGWFTCILKDRIIKIKQIANKIIFVSSNENNLEEAIIDYFDLKRDYEKINKKINIDKIMNKCTSKCEGYKIIKQDFFETCISYIISQNNNVGRISKSINEISRLYGEKVLFEEKEYYLFPKYEDIKNISLNELRNCGVGFRDKYIINFLENYESLVNIDKLNTSLALERLMSIKGIGLKVASCILLFSLQRFDVYPIDTWVKKFMLENYNIEGNKIEEIVKEKFGAYSGLAMQYMFHSQRNINKKGEI